MTNHLSISSSNQRLPSGRWSGVWLASIVLVIAILLGLELLLRTAGYRPAYDGVATWHLFWAKRSSASWLILGSSRAKSAVDPQVWSRENFGAKTFQLAMVATSPLPFLEELAHDKQFSGKVLVDMMPELVTGEATVSSVAAHDALQDHNEIVSSPALYAETVIKATVSGLASQRPGAPIAALRILWGLASGQESRPYFAQSRDDRFLAIDFSALEADKSKNPTNQRSGILPFVEGKLKKALDQIESRREMGGAVRRQILANRLRDVRGGTPRKEIGNNVRPAGLSVELDSLASYANRIQRRGGQVVYVLFPRCGKIKEDSEKRFPTQDFLDQFAAREGIIAIDTEEGEGFSPLECHDGSHLDVSQAGPFTAELADAVRTILKNRASGD